jgi:hypothetical protein
MDTSLAILQNLKSFVTIAVSICAGVLDSKISKTLNKVARTHLKFNLYVVKASAI